MASKDFCLPFKEDITVSDNSKDQYSNLNLNQNQKCSNFNSATPKHLSSKNQNVESSDLIDKNVSQKNLNSWSSPKSSSNWLNAASKKQKLKRCKNSSLNSINKSTLSLHISAHENSNESATFDSTENAGLKKDKEKSHLKKQLFSDLASIIQNPFEFPRQQEAKQFSADDPEVMEFKASQKLLEPNKATASKSIQSNDVNFGLNRPSSLL
uniref:Uncharacterized protein n=1 Tax=Panagrolaimus sp. PS1159 TaxID=55785 RepID=A0AC35GYC2_9BILA